MSTHDETLATPLFSTTRLSEDGKAPAEPRASRVRADFINSAYGIIGRTVSTKFEPNTSSHFLFWLADRTKVAGAEQGSATDIEIGNIVVAISEDHNELTFGTVVEMRSYSDVDSFIADYL